MPRTLIQKLDLKPAARTCLVDVPETVAVVVEEQDAIFFGDGILTADPLDFILAFARDRETLARHLATYKPRLASDGMFWLCWPKRSSKITTDLHRETVREMGLESGLVDVKVCAIDADWSGLKFVYRLSDR